MTHLNKTGKVRESEHPGAAYAATKTMKPQNTLNTQNDITTKHTNETKKTIVKVLLRKTLTISSEINGLKKILENVRQEIRSSE